MSELPQGWARVSVEELVDLNPKNICDDATTVGFVPLNRLGTRYRDKHSFEPRQWSDVKRGYSHFQDGDVLLARITPCFENGKAGIVHGLPNGLGAGSTEYFVFRPKAGIIDPRYLLAFFKTSHFMLEGERLMAGAVGQQRVPKRYVLGARIPLAPFPEQTQIVNKLDVLAELLDRCRARLGRIPHTLKRFREAVLEAAVSGRLTEEWRARHTEANVWNSLPNLQNAQRTRRGVTEGALVSRDLLPDDDSPETWLRANAAGLLEKGLLHDMKDGNHGANHPKASEFTPHGVPFITAKQVHGFRIDFETAPRLSGAALKRIRVGCAQPHDVILTHKGTVGRVAITEQKCLLTPQTTYYRVNPAFVVPRFLMYFMASPKFARQLDSIKSQTTRDFVPISAQYGLVHLIPPKAEQVEITRRIDELFQYADSVESRYRTCMSATDRLLPSILTKAFRGELVSQDSGETPSRNKEREQGQTVIIVPSRRGRKVAPVRERKREKGRGRKRA